MTKKVVTVSPDTLISKVADILHINSFSGVPVIGKDKTVLGVVTEKELFSQDYRIHLPTYIHILKQTDFVLGGKKELPYEAGRLSRITAGEVMTKETPFVSPDLALDKLAAKFSTEGMNVFPVVDGTNTLLGIVSRSDLLKQFASASVPARSHTASRHVDNEFGFVEKDIQSRYALVAKRRANVWVITATILFIVGFLAGIIYVVNPGIFHFGRSGVTIESSPPF